MSRAATPETDRASDVNPPIRHNAPWRIVSAEAVSGYRLIVKFVDGTSGEVDLTPLLARKNLGSVFEPLRDEAFFGSVRVVAGAVEWPNGADLAPDAMYDAIRDHGRWVPD